MGKSEWMIQHVKDGTLLVFIPEGKFCVDDTTVMGQFPVKLNAYYIGISCVTNEQYAHFLSKCQPVKSELDKWIWIGPESGIRQTGDQYESDQEKANHPVNLVSWYGAEAYCDWAGLRLPSELEWEKAARGIDGREYPWGVEWDTTRCRNGCIRNYRTTSSVWDYPEGNSPWGMYQMSGNVWEWCTDWFESDQYQLYKDDSISPPISGTAKVLRGGDWHSFEPKYFRCAHRFFHTPGAFNDKFGFRCAKSF